VLCILTGCAEQTIIDSVLEIVKRYHFSKIIIESLPLVVCAHTGINTFAFVGFPQDTIIDVLPLLNVLKK
jgi:fatty acid-binding protein DegV